MAYSTLVFITTAKSYSTIPRKVCSEVFFQPNLLFVTFFTFLTLTPILASTTNLGQLYNGLKVRNALAYFAEASTKDEKKVFWHWQQSKLIGSFGSSSTDNGEAQGSNPMILAKLLLEKIVWTNFSTIFVHFFYFFFSGTNWLIDWLIKNVVSSTLIK